MARPSFTRMWNNFPDHVKFRTLGDLYRHLGGKATLNINAPGFGENGNACASRMSVALNQSGSLIRPSAKYKTIGCADKSRIIFNVIGLKTYLNDTFGPPDDDETFPFDDAFSGQKGIIAFNVEGWSDASGHIALYNGSQYREASDDYSRYKDGTKRTIKANFWKLP